MALTNKLTDIVRNTAYALTAGLALASPLTSPLYSAEKPAEPAQNYSQTQKSDSLESKTKYSIEEFRKAYGAESWSKIDNTKIKGIEKKWSELSGDYRKTLIEIYTNPNNFYKNQLTEELRKEYDNFSRTELPNKEEEKKTRKKQGFFESFFQGFFRGMGEAFLEENYPWIIDVSNLSQREKLSIYMDFRLQKSFISQEEAEDKENIDKEFPRIEFPK